MIKLFSNHVASSLENAVNTWIKDNAILVKHIQYNTSINNFGSELHNVLIVYN